MALIKCSECGREVSDKAASCIHCGAPLVASEHAVVTTQSTAKRYKGMQLAGFALVAVGVVVLVGAVKQGAPGAIGALTMAAGFALYAGGRIAAWWHHG